MARLTPKLKAKANAGDISSLLCIHDFCRSHNVTDEPTFASIMDIAFHNLRLELHPNLKNARHLPRTSRAWLKGISISICLLVEGLDSLLAATVGHRVGTARSLESVPPASCHRISKHWDQYIAPAISVLTDWYILDDLQPPIAAHIHQDTLHTGISKLFGYLIENQIKTHPQIQRTKGVTFCAMRLFLRTVEQYPHSSGVYLGYLCKVMVDVGGLAIQTLANLDFIPALLCFLPKQRMLLEDRDYESSYVLTIACATFQASPKPMANTAMRYPELLDELLIMLEKHRDAYCSLSRTVLPAASEFILRRSEFIMLIVTLIGELLKNGSWKAQRQALKRKILRILVRPFVPELRNSEINAAIKEYLDKTGAIVACLGGSLCQYSILTAATHEVGVIEREEMDAELMSSEAERLQNLKKIWTSFKGVLHGRLAVLEEFKSKAIQQGPVCSMKSMCAKDVRGRSYRCSGCKAAYYCSRRCQEDHWNNIHKQECKPLSESHVLPDERDLDFLEYQLSYDLDHHWHSTFTNPSNTPISSVYAMVVDYKAIPPQIKLQHMQLKDFSDDEVRAEARARENSGEVTIVVLLPDVQLKTMILHSCIRRELLAAALTSDGVRREKGEKLLEIQMIMFEDGRDHVVKICSSANSLHLPALGTFKITRSS